MTATRRALALVALAGCASSNPERGGEENLVGVYMTRDEIMHFGTRRYAAKPTEVFKAALGALKIIGYDIASESVEKGVILTTRKFVRVQVGFAAAVTHSRQFVVRLFDDPQTHQTVVSAMPKVFEGDFDISDRPVWDLRGERLIWHDLFAQIDLLCK